MGRPAVVDLLLVGPGETYIAVGSGRIELDRPLEQLDRLSVRLRGGLVQLLAGELEEIERFEIPRPLAQRRAEAIALDGAAERGRDAQRQLVLDREQILQRAVVALGPDLPAGRGVDQGHVGQQPAAVALEAALDDVADAELLADPARVARRVAVGEASCRAPSRPSPAR